MMYGSAQPMGSRVIGHIGGTSLAPRVLGGGLAALGADSGNYSSSYGSYTPGMYDGQTRSLGFVDDGAYGNAVSFGTGSISVVGGNSMAGQYSYAPAGKVVGSVPSGRGTAGAVRPWDGTVAGLQPQMAQAGLIGSGMPAQRPLGTMSRPTETYASAYQQNGLEYGNQRQVRPNGTSVLSARPLTREEMQAQGHSVGVQRNGQALPHFREFDQDGGLVIQRPQQTVVTSSPATIPAQANPFVVGGTRPPMETLPAEQNPAMERFQPNMFAAPPKFPSEPMMAQPAMAPQVSNALDSGPALCSILPIPSELMMHISDQDLNDLQDQTGATIQCSQAEGGTDWEVRLLGSAEVRSQAHQAIENLLNDRLNGSALIYDDIPEPAPMANEQLPLSADHLRLLDTNDLDLIKQNAGVEIDQFEPEPGNEGGLTLVFNGSSEATQNARDAVVDLVNQRMAEEAMQQSQAPEGVVKQAHPDMVVEGPPVSTVMATDPKLFMNNDIGEVAPAAGQVGELTLQIPAECVGLIYEEDLENIKKQLPVEIAVYHPEEQGGNWTLALTGTEEAREGAHRFIQDLIEERAAAPQEQIPGSMPNTAQIQMDQQMEAPPTDIALTGEADTVPCTILPVPYDYLKLIYNLEQIQQITGCIIKAQEPETEGGDWQLMLYGKPTQRQMAHQAIEDTLNAALKAIEDGGQPA